MVDDAGFANPVAHEPSQGVVILGDLDQLAVSSTLPAPITDAALPGDAGSGYEVRAIPVRAEAAALAAGPGRAGAGPDLVAPAGVGAGGDEPTPAALVAGEDQVLGDRDDAQAAKDVIRCPPFLLRGCMIGFLGALGRESGYPLLRQGTYLLGRASGCC